MQDTIMPQPPPLRRVAAGMAALALLASPAARAGVVISQIYGGGGQSGALYGNDFIVLFNDGPVTVDLAGWSVQYASATGTGNFSANPVTPLSGTLAPGAYFLVQEASAGAVGAPLPTPDASGTVSMSATDGKVIVATVATGLACNGGSTPCSEAQLDQIADLVGWGSANFYETAAAPATTVTTAILRAANGCTDTGNNAADFAVGMPAPLNRSSVTTICAAAPVPEPSALPFLVVGMLATVALGVVGGGRARRQCR